MHEVLIKELSGFSGCKIQLLSLNGNYVRKISKNVHYNKRLQKQMEKQVFFQTYSNKKIGTPKIIQSGYQSDLFYFDMEYIQGSTLVEEIMLSTNLSKITNDLLEIIKLISAINLGFDVSLSDAVSKKISEIQFEEDILSKMIIKAKNMPTIAATFCHGDLTLENIIYDRNIDKYYLIDFLDNFADHYWFDIAKIFQDVEGYWYAFKNPELDKEVLKIKMFFINKVITSLLESNYLTHHSFLNALNFLRIIPYAKAEQLPYLRNKLYYFLKE